MRWNEVFKETVQLDELFDRSADWQWTHVDPHSREAKFEVNGIPYSLDVSQAGNSGIWGTEFSNRSAWIHKANSWGNTGEQGSEASQVFGTVIAILKDFIKEEQPEGLHFQAYAKDDRSELYSKMLQHQKRSIEELGYATDIQNAPGRVDFYLKKTAA